MTMEPKFSNLIGMFDSIKGVVKGFDNPYKQFGQTAEHIINSGMAEFDIYNAGSSSYLSAYIPVGELHSDQTEIGISIRVTEDDVCVGMETCESFDDLDDIEIDNGSKSYWYFSNITNDDVIFYVDKLLLEDAIKNAEELLKYLKSL